MHIGFIGAGKIGCTLGKYLKLNGKQVVGFYSQEKAETTGAAEFTQSRAYNSIKELASESDLIFVTTTDSAISKVWNELKQLPIKGKIICHCSGAVPSSIFEGINELGASGFSLHPMCMVSDKFETYKMFDKVSFTIEGGPAYKDEILALFRSMGNPIEEISKSAKALYHAAGVTMSSLILAVAKMGVDMYSKCGLKKEFVENTWLSIFMHTSENITKLGLVDGLSGPLERGDYTTIHSHLGALDSNEKMVYVGLSKILLEVAKGKNPGRDYSQVERVLTEAYPLTEAISKQGFSH